MESLVFQKEHIIGEGIVVGKKVEEVRRVGIDGEFEQNKLYMYEILKQ